MNMPIKTITEQKQTKRKLCGNIFSQSFATNTHIHFHRIHRRKLKPIENKFFERKP